MRVMVAVDVRVVVEEEEDRALVGYWAAARRGRRAVVRRARVGSCILMVFGLEELGGWRWWVYLDIGIYDMR